MANKKKVDKESDKAVDDIVAKVMEQMGSFMEPLGEHLAQEKKKAEETSQRLRAATRSRRVKALTAKLSGHILRRSENERDTDYSDGGYFFEKSEALFLYADLTFRHEVKTFSSVSSGGLSMPSESTKSSDGKWAITIREDKPSLILWKGYDMIASWQLAEGGAKILYVDGKPWEIYRIPT